MTPEISLDLVSRIIKENVEKKKVEIVELLVGISESSFDQIIQETGLTPDQLMQKYWHHIHPMIQSDFNYIHMENEMQMTFKKMKAHFEFKGDSHDSTS